MKNFFLQKGITVIEILIVIAVIGALIAVIALPFGSFRSRQALENTTALAVSVLTEARARTMAGLGDTNYPVLFEVGQLTLFSGSTYASNHPDNEVFIYEQPVTLQAITVSGGGSKITFDRLKGTTSNSGSVVLTIPSGDIRTLSISSSGSINR